MEMKILGSRCAVSDDFLEIVENLADSLGLNYTIEKVVDEDAMKEFDVTVDCMYGYCPGCVSNHRDSPDKHTPALVINGELICHSRIPPLEELSAALERYK